MKTFTANEDMAHTLFIQKDWKDPLQTTTRFTGDSKESTLFYSTNPFNLSWEKKNSGSGLFRIPSHKSVSLQRVLPEMGCPTLSKFNTGKVAPFWSCYWKLCGFWYPLFILVFMVVLVNYLKKSSLTVKLHNTKEGSLTVKLLACAALYGWSESQLGPQLSDHNRLAPR